MRRGVGRMVRDGACRRVHTDQRAGADELLVGLAVEILRCARDDKFCLQQNWEQEQLSRGRRLGPDEVESKPAPSKT